MTDAAYALTPTNTKNMNERLDKILEIDTCSPLDMPSPGEVIVNVADVVIAELMPPESNTALEPASAGTPAPLAILPDAHLEELADDMEYARTNMKDIIDQSKSAMISALEAAEQSGEARSYEVVAQMITAIIQANKDLISLHKTRKDTLKTDKEVKGTGEATPSEIHINKAVFVGRAQDLLRSLKEIEKTNGSS